MAHVEGFVEDALSRASKAFEEELIEAFNSRHTLEFEDVVRDWITACAGFSLLWMLAYLVLSRYRRRKEDREALAFDQFFFPFFICTVVVTLALSSLVLVTLSTFYAGEGVVLQPVPFDGASPSSSPSSSPPRGHAPAPTSPHTSGERDSSQDAHVRGEEEAVSMFDLWRWFRRTREKIRKEEDWVRTMIEAQERDASLRGAGASSPHDLWVRTRNMRSGDDDDDDASAATMCGDEGCDTHTLWDTVLSNDAAERDRAGGDDPRRSTRGDSDAPSDVPHWLWYVYHDMNVIDRDFLSYYWGWVFVASNFAFFFVVPFAYLYNEAEGILWRDRGFVARVTETSVVVVLLTVLIQGMLFLVGALLGLGTDTDGKSLARRYLFLFLPTSNSVLAAIGSLIALVMTPLGFYRLVEAAYNMRVPVVLRVGALTERVETLECERDALALRLQRAAAGVPDTPHDHGDAHHAGVVVASDAELEAMHERLRALDEEIATQHEVLNKSSATNWRVWWHNTRAFVCVVGSLLLTTHIVFGVFFHLLFGATFPFLLTTGMSRLLLVGMVPTARDDRFGSVMNVVHVSYLFLATMVGLYSSVLAPIAPRRRRTPLHLVVVHSATLLVVASALPIVAALLGMSTVDMLDVPRHVSFLHNGGLCSLYKAVFGVLTFSVLLRLNRKPPEWVLNALRRIGVFHVARFLSRHARRLWKRMRSAARPDRRPSTMATPEVVAAGRRASTMPPESPATAAAVAAVAAAASEAAAAAAASAAPPGPSAAMRGSAMSELARRPSMPALHVKRTASKAALLRRSSGLITPPSRKIA